MPNPKQPGSIEDEPEFRRFLEFLLNDGLAHPETLIDPEKDVEEDRRLLDGVVAAITDDALQVEPGYADASWLDILDKEDRAEVRRAVRGALLECIRLRDTRPMVQLLRGWKATAEYVAAGRPLDDVDWSSVIPLLPPYPDNGDQS